LSAEIRAPSFALCVGIAALITLVRLIGQHFSIVDLYFDESQYWAWAEQPAFSYFSKPPLIAWIIAAAERVCGSTEACIRAPSPIFYFGTSLLIYALGNTLYDRRVAFWAALVLVRLQAWRWLKIGIGIVVQALLLVGDSMADRLTIPGLAKADIYQPTMGWRALGDEASRLARQIDAPIIATGRRDDIASLVYYLRNEKRAILAWPESGSVSDHFQMTRPLTATAAEPILLITRCTAPTGLADVYASVEPLGPFQTRSGPTTVRNYYAFKLGGPRPINLSRIC
jgi:Dolichyl-phosphate-mannose-protein mannosyltransferase